MSTPTTTTYGERGGSRRAAVEGARVRALLAQAKAAGDGTEGACRPVVVVYSGGSRVESCACSVARYRALYGEPEFRVEEAAR